MDIFCPLETAEKWKSLVPGTKVDKEWKPL